MLVKRLHEYKRQLLKALHIIWLYHRIKADPDAEIVPRTFIFGAKAAPGYHMAKRIIKLIHNVAAVRQRRPGRRGRLKVVFPANFNVSLAEKIYPAADISEQISMAGKEASGTGNMKFALNGAADRRHPGRGQHRDPRARRRGELLPLRADRRGGLRHQGAAATTRWSTTTATPELRGVHRRASPSGQFSDGDRELFQPDRRLAARRTTSTCCWPTSESYVDCSERAAEAYRDQDSWTRMSILNTARCGFFSSDRTIRQYCDEIWRVAPLPIG